MIKDSLQLTVGDVSIEELSIMKSFRAENASVYNDGWLVSHGICVSFRRAPSNRYHTAVSLCTLYYNLLLRHDQWRHLALALVHVRIR